MLRVDRDLHVPSPNRPDQSLRSIARITYLTADVAGDHAATLTVAVSHHTTQPASRRRPPRSISHPHHHDPLRNRLDNIDGDIIATVEHDRFPDGPAALNNPIQFMSEYDQRPPPDDYGVSTQAGWRVADVLTVDISASPPSSCPPLRLAPPFTEHQKKEFPLDTNKPIFQQ